jgi:hypothetical protein
MPRFVPETRFANKIKSTIDHLDGALPSAPLPATLTKAKVVSAASALAASLQSDTLNPEIFTTDAFWRDQFSLTHNLRTFYSPNAICAAWADVSSSANVRNVNVVPETVNLSPSWATVLITFDADISGTQAECQGLL